MIQILVSRSETEIKARRDREDRVMSHCLHGSIPCVSLFPLPANHHSRRRHNRKEQIANHRSKGLRECAHALKKPTLSWLSGIGPETGTQFL
jgi:hypothetical protein